MEGRALEQVWWKQREVPLPIRNVRKRKDWRLLGARNRTHLFELKCSGKENGLGGDRKFWDGQPSATWCSLGALELLPTQLVAPCLC